jgi:hypothetical protein
MPAHYRSCRNTGAGVRKPSKNETAGGSSTRHEPRAMGILLAQRMRPGALVTDAELRGHADGPTEALSAIETGLIGG